MGSSWSESRPIRASSASERGSSSRGTRAIISRTLANVDRATADLMAAAQRPFTGAAFGGPSGPPAWRSGIPCWYLLGTEDRAIPPALQRFMAERANATIVEVAASHVSFVSQPDVATQLISQAVEATVPTGSRT